MVRTKDLLLIVVVLVMLFMAISATLASRMITKQMQEDALSGAVTAEAPVYESATDDSGSMDRAANIARLRSLLAAGDVIESSPSVESSPVLETETESIDGMPTCLGAGTGIEVARSWPLVGVAVKTVGANRVVAHLAPIPAGTVNESGSTTVVASGATNERVLLSLPLYPGKNAEPTCMRTEIVGVTAAGSLLFNNDIVLYRQTGTETLIGYALDGFPIYGAYAGETDSCGGYDGPGGYRYVVSPQDQTLIECFVGSPQSFSL